jgi:hypothetical protein
MICEQIDDLFLQFGRDVHPDIEAKAREIIKEVRAQGTTRVVQQLRACGLPETKILDYLANEQRKRIPARNGPRDDDDALIRAAAQLMKIQLPPPAPTPRPPTAVRNGPPPRPSPAS